MAGLIRSSEDSLLQPAVVRNSGQSPVVRVSIASVPLLPDAPCMNPREVILQPVAASEEARFQALMEAHHYLGALPKIGQPCGISPPGTASGWRC